MTSYPATMAQYTIPTVIEKTPQGERAYDVYSRLLAERIIFLGTEIDDDVANVVIAQLLHLESSGQDREIAIYINSPVSTWCVGQAASTAAVLLAGGDPGRRFVLEHSRVLLGQPAAGGQQGTVSDLTLQAKEMVRSGRRSRRCSPGIRRTTSRRCARTWTATRSSPRRRQWPTASPTRSSAGVSCGQPRRRGSPCPG